MYGNNFNRYLPNYINNTAVSEQSLYDQIDGQINQLVNMRNQIKNNSNQQQNQQPPSINQTFQLSPNGGGIKYANSIEDVSKETVFFDTPFFSKDLSVLWLKNASGDIKAYELNEIVQKDEKDLKIELLMAQLNELKGMMTNVSDATNDNATESSKNSTRIDKTNGITIEESKPTSVQRVSTSKKGK